MFHRSRRVAFPLAALLALAVNGSALAAQTSDSFTVNSSIAVSGIPASISYGTLDPGTTSAVQTISMSIVANVPWHATVSGTSFGSVPASARQGSTTDTTATAYPYVPFGTAPYNGTATWLSDGAGSFTASLNLKVTVPANQAPGTYSGTITFTFTAP